MWLAWHDILCGEVCAMHCAYMHPGINVCVYVCVIEDHTIHKHTHTDAITFLMPVPIKYLLQSQYTHTHTHSLTYYPSFSSL